MPLDVLNRSWPGVNATRAYPLVEWGSRLDATGSFRLPDDLIVGLYFPVGPAIDVDPTRFYIKTVTVFATGVSVTLGYDDGVSPDVAVATAALARSQFKEFTPVALYGVGSFAASIGKIVFGGLDGVDAQGSGQFNFARLATTLDVDAVRPQLKGVGSIGVAAGGAEPVPLTGAVSLSLGSNLKVTVSGANSFRIDAISGVGLNTDCDCTGLPAAAAPIRSVNGVTAPDGKLTIAGEDCVQVSSLGAGLQFKDSCSSPCCGCAEKQQLQQAIDQILDQIRTVKNFTNRLQTEVQQMTGVVISSKVSDTGCVDCTS